MKALLAGLLLGVVLPLAILAPAAPMVVSVVAEGRTYFLLPALSLLVVPAALVGFLAARPYEDRRDAWRLAVGLFLGGSLVVDVLFWTGGAALPLPNRLGQALFGGVLLAGFWLFVGALLGFSVGYGRRDRAQARGS